MNPDNYFKKLPEGTKIYKRKIDVRLLVVAPVFGLIVFILTGKVVAGLVATPILLPLIGLWLIANKTECYAFSTEDDLCRVTSNGTILAKIKTTDINSFRYKRIGRTNDKIRAGYATNTFMIDFNNKENSTYQMFIPINGWGDQKDELFKQISSWLAKSAIILDSKTQSILNKSTEK